MAAFELPGVIDIAGAGALKAAFSQRLEQGDPLMLEGGGVERIDASGLQLLLAFFYEAQARGQSIGWQSASDEIKACARMLGLAEPLQLA